MNTPQNRSYNQNDSNEIEESINESLFVINGDIQEKDKKEKGRELETISEEKVNKRKNGNNIKSMDLMK